MRENEFEKRVQQKMEGFDLSPSPELWEEVERRIRKEKKRRFVFWWLLLFTGLGGGAIALLLDTNNKKTTGIAVNSKVNNTDTPVRVSSPGPGGSLNNTNEKAKENTTPLLNEDEKIVVRN